MAKKKELKVFKENYYGFNHSAVAKQFEGDLTFVNDFCVNGEYAPVSVYRAAKPNVEKGHKKYMLLQLREKEGLIRGMSEEEMEKWRFQEAIHCLNCDIVIYSTMRHDMVACSCNPKKCVHIDGGRDYTSVSFEKGSLYEMGKLDLLTDKFKANKKSVKKHKKSA